MASQSLFTSIRVAHGFPDNLSIAQLRTISLRNLQDGSMSESGKLLDAAINDGFFYLDLTDPGEEKFLNHVDEIFAMSKAIFDLEDKIKLHFDVDLLGSLKVNGYKPLGRNKGGVKGRLDGFESYALSRNAMFGLTDEVLPCPRQVADYITTVRAFMSSCSDHSQLIFRTLSDALCLEPHERFESFHRPSHPSPDVIRLLKYHEHQVNTAVPYVPQVPHTDLGSLTFLFAPTPGLQILRPHVDEWAYVQPRACHAVVNLGDALSMLTGGFFRSSLHRVGPLPGADMQERYSFAFLMRPENHTMMRPVTSPMIVPDQDGSRESQPHYTSEEWMVRKFEVLRAGTNQEEANESSESSILTRAIQVS